MLGRVGKNIVRATRSAVLPECPKLDRGGRRVRIRGPGLARHRHVPKHELEAPRDEAYPYRGRYSMHGRPTIWVSAYLTLALNFTLSLPLLAVRLQSLEQHFFGDAALGVDKGDAERRDLHVAVRLVVEEQHLARRDSALLRELTTVQTKEVVA